MKLMATTIYMASAANIYLFLYIQVLANYTVLRMKNHLHWKNKKESYVWKKKDAIKTTEIATSGKDLLVRVGRKCASNELTKMCAIHICFMKWSEKRRRKNILNNRCHKLALFVYTSKELSVNKSRRRL